ncbi:MAG TPA: MFS transporter [Polyangiaceae bacterium]|nr:MFS transporter [Polyangiaceae bacterium]
MSEPLALGAPSLRQRAWPWTAAAALSAALAPLNSTMIAVALPEMASDLGQSSALVRHGLVTSYLLVGIVLQSLGGKLADRIGYRRALRLGQGIFVIGSLLGFALPQFIPLALARMIMAAAGAVVVPSAVALLRNELPPERRGRAFGVFGAVMSMSAAIGPKLGSLIAGHLGWRTIFLVNLPWLAACVVLALFAATPGSEAAKAGARAERAGFDFVGSVLIGVSLAAVVVGSQAAPYRWLLLLGLCGLVAFGFWEGRVKDPVIDLSLFARPAFSAGAFVIALHNLAMYSLLFELPQVAGRLFNAGPESIGGVLSVMMVSMVLAAPIAGRLSERHGARPITLGGCLAGVAGVLALALSPFASLGAALPGLVLLGIGLGLASAPAQAAAMSAVPREQSGMAAGLTSTLRYLGGIVGLAILGWLLGDQLEPAVVLHQHHQALWVFGISLSAAAVCALGLPKGTTVYADAPRPA